MSRSTLQADKVGQLQELFSFFVGGGDRGEQKARYEKQPHGFGGTKSECQNLAAASVLP